MRRIARKILQILDGTPAVYGKQERGQSLVEMAFITPLILVLIAGIVEIGWLTNNYLTLQEVTKVGARRGTVLTGDLSPLNWDNRGSSLPPGQTGGSSIDSGDASLVDPALTEAQNRRANVRRCDQLDLVPGFYNIILCTMLDSMEPLTIRFQDSLPPGEIAVDDIAISVFAIQTVHNAPVTGVPFGTGGNIDPATNGDVDFDSFTPYVDNDNFEDNTWDSVVVGRYPINANECNVDVDSNLINPPVERDPFDYVNDRNLTTRVFTLPTGTVTIPLELARQEGAVWVPSGGDGANPADVYGYTFRERQRGFVYTGQHRIEAKDGQEFDCFGSEFDIYEIQELMQLPKFQMTPDELAAAQAGNPNFGLNPDGTQVDVRQYLPNQGLVLVEMWWQHDLLLDLAVFNPIFNALGSDQTTLYVWAAFPVPSVEPRLTYFPLDQ